MPLDSTSSSPIRSISSTISSYCENSIGFKILFDSEHVTVEEVEAKLKGIAELSSYSGEYTVTYGKDTARYWLDNIKIFSW